MKKRYVYFIMILMWISVIFIFSNQNGNESSTLSNGITKNISRLLWNNFDEYSEPQQQEITGAVSFVIRKLAHVTEYFVLTILVSLFCFTYSLKTKYRLIIISASALVTAVLDEIHQSFVNGRNASFIDVLIDMIGATIGILIFLIFIKVIAIHKTSKTGNVIITDGDTEKC